MRRWANRAIIRQWRGRCELLCRLLGQGVQGVRLGRSAWCVRAVHAVRGCLGLQNVQRSPTPCLAPLRVFPESTPQGVSLSLFLQRSPHWRTRVCDQEWPMHLHPLLHLHTLPLHTSFLRVRSVRTASTASPSHFWWTSPRRCGTSASHLMRWSCG